MSDLYETHIVYFLMTRLIYQWEDIHRLPTNKPTAQKFRLATSSYFHSLKMQAFIDLHEHRRYLKLGGNLGLSEFSVVVCVISGVFSRKWLYGSCASLFTIQSTK